jgi:UDP-3-O-[3-hydroxymyristoyl] glucosamine N-acyltransferase
MVRGWVLAGSWLATSASGADLDANGCDDGFAVSGACVHPSASLGAGVTIGAGAQVGAGAVLGAGVGVAAGASVAPRAVLGGGTQVGIDASVGRRTAIGVGGSLGADNVVAADVVAGTDLVAEPSVIVGYGSALGDHVRLRQGATVGNLVELGDFAEVGAGASVGRGAVVASGADAASGVVLDGDVGAGAQIGAGVHVAAGATVRSGAVVDEGATVGAGARIGRDATIEPDAVIEPGAVVRAGATVTERARVPTGEVVPRGSSWSEGANFPPTAGSFAITPTAPEAGVAPLLCGATVAPSDPESEPLTVTVNWIRDGLPYLGTRTTTTYPNDTIPTSAQVGGQVWSCSVTVFDGVYTAYSASSAAVTVVPAFQAPWLRTLRGSPGTPIVFDLALDASGNLYMAGVVIGGWTQPVSLPAAGQANDSFVASYSPDGSLRWLRSFGSTDDDGAYDVAVSGGDVYVAGRIRGTMSFGSTSLSYSPASVSHSAVYVLKMNAGNGDVVWAAKSGGSVSEEPEDLAANENGAFVVGTYSSSTTIGATSLSGGTGTEAFVAQIDPSGAWQWARRAGGSGADRGKAIAIDADGDLIVASSFLLTLNPSSATMHQSTYNSQGSEDVLIARLSQAGARLSEWTLGGPGGDAPWSLHATPTHTTLAGSHGNAMTIGTSTVGGTNSQMFIAELDVDGRPLRGWQGNGTGTIPFGVARSGNDVYVAGSFSNTLVLGSTTLNVNFQNKLFVGRLSAATGTWTWGRQGTGLEYSQARAMTLRTQSPVQVYVGGYHNGTTTFGATTATGAAGALIHLDANGNW